DLWLLVVSEFHAVEPCRGRHPLPVGVPTAPGRIEVADVHGAGLKEVAAAAGRVFALSGADGDAAASPYLAHVATIVGPDAWLLEPANVEVRHAATEVERLLDRVSLVGIDGQHEIISGRLAGDANTLGVGARLEAADLELGTAEAERPPLFHLIADAREVAAVIAADYVDGHTVAIPSPQAPEGLFERLADGVPDREVDAGKGNEADAPVPELIEGGRVAELPAALVGKGVLADQPRRDFVADHADDVRQRLVLVGGVGLPDDPLLGDHARDNARTVLHAVVAASINPVERDDDRNERDLANRE